MNTFNMLTCTMAGLVLTLGLSTPSFAQATSPATATATAIGAIDFGDDSGEWTKDGECDDPRFEGTGTADELVDADLLKDATDCRAAFDAGTVTLRNAGAPDAAVDFGDDASQWSKDGECDDPRFEGSGAASQLLDDDALHDATDCRAAFDAGTIALKGDGADIPAATPGDIAGIVFGDDTGKWNNDGECDDPRFEGDNVANEPAEENRMRDASDCRAAVEAGNASFKADATNEPTPFDYGNDNSKYAHDGVCDDKRFVGDGVDKKLLDEDTAKDASDCRALVESGSISIIPVFDPAYAAGAPYDSKGINFGDNTSSYANDNQCDDPRFQGPGTASTLLDSDLRHDRDDCKAAFEAGTAILVD